MSKRFLILGASGYIGSALCAGLKEDFELFATYYSHPFYSHQIPTFELDAFNGENISKLCYKLKPDALIYCIGDHRYAEVDANMERCERLNIRALQVIGKAAPMGLPIVYFSNDEVFGNAIKPRTPVEIEENPGAFEYMSTPIPESFATSPLNRLSGCKARTESFLTGSKRPTYIFRLGWLYGESLGWPKYQRFSYSENIRFTLKEGKKIFLPQDMLRSPLYIGDLVRAMRLFLASEKKNNIIYHLASREQISIAEMMKNFAKQFSLDANLIEANEAAVSGMDGVPRPLYSCLSNERFEKEFNFQFQDSNGGFKEYKERLFQGYSGTWA